MFHAGLWRSCGESRGALASLQSHHLDWALPFPGLIQHQARASAQAVTQDHVAASGGPLHDNTDRSCWPAVAASTASEAVSGGCCRPCYFHATGGAGDPWVRLAQEALVASPADSLVKWSQGRDSKAKARPMALWTTPVPPHPGSPSGPRQEAQGPTHPRAP